MKVEDIIAFLIQLELKIKFGAKRSNRWRLNGKESRRRVAEPLAGGKIQIRTF